MRRAHLDDKRSARAANRCLDLGVRYRLHTDLEGCVQIHIGSVVCDDQEVADAEIRRLSNGGEPVAARSAEEVAE